MRVPLTESLSKFGVLLLALLAINTISPKPVEAATRDARGLQGNCTGNATGAVDCIFPTQAYTSYVNLSKITYNSGSGADFWICNATDGYNPPTSTGATYSGCSWKNLGPGWAPSFVSPYPGKSVDVYVNVHNNGWLTYFRFD
jgi:hypothetical protein